MQPVLCDICERPIRGPAYEFHFIRGEVGKHGAGTPRIVQRQGAHMIYLCDPCGGWVRGAMDHLRTAQHENDLDAAVSRSRAAGSER